MTCPWPVVKSSGLCCGTEPCSLEWERPCDAFGGCLDRSTCAGCDRPKIAADPRVGDDGEALADQRRDADAGEETL